GFDAGLVARYTDTHLRETDDDFSTFPSFPAARQTHSDTVEYYDRATIHAVSPDGLLEQTLGAAFTRKRTSTREPDSPLSIAIGQRVKFDWQGAVKLSRDHSLVLGAEHQREQIRNPVAPGSDAVPLSAGNNTDSGYLELQSQLAGSLYSALNARYDRND